MNAHSYARPEPPLSAASETHDEWLDASGLEQARGIRERRISSEELVRGYLARIERRNPALHAFVEVAYQRAPKWARVKDALTRKRSDLPPFHGVPIGIKDMGLVRGFRAAVRRALAALSVGTVRRLQRARAAQRGLRDDRQARDLGGRRDAGHRAGHPSTDAQSLEPRAHPGWIVGRIRCGGRSRGCCRLRMARTAADRCAFPLRCADCLASNLRADASAMLTAATTHACSTAAARSRARSTMLLRCSTR